MDLTDSDLNTVENNNIDGLTFEISNVSYLISTTNEIYHLWVHPSVHFLYPLNPSVGSRGGWSLSQRSTQRQTRQTTMHTVIFRKFDSVCQSVTLVCSGVSTGDPGKHCSLTSMLERRVTPWTGHQSITGPHRDKRDKQPCICLNNIQPLMFVRPTLFELERWHPKWRRSWLCC